MSSSSRRAWFLACFALAACEAGGATTGGAESPQGVPPQMDGSTAEAGICTTSAADGTLCSGGDNGPGLTGESVNNQGLIGNSVKGRGVYGSSISSEGGYFSSTDGDGLLAYSFSGYSGHFTGGRGVLIDPPGAADAPAVTVNGPALLALPAAASGVIPVCGTLDAASGLFTLSKCDDRLDKLEAEVAALKARLDGPDAGAP